MQKISFKSLLLSPPVILSVLVLVLSFAWHGILGFLLHALIIFMELLELAFDHLLENVLHLEGHSAQMYTAWTGLAIAITLLISSFRWGKKTFLSKYSSFGIFISEQRKWSREHWFTLALPLIVLLIIVFFF